MSILAVLENGGSDAAAITQRASHLLAAIEQHRTALHVFLEKRRQHVSELRDAGWQLAPIGELYGLTPERVRQLVTGSPRIDVNDDTEVAS